MLKKIIDFLTASIFETEEEAENRELYNDLRLRISHIQRDNKYYLIENHIKPFLEKEYRLSNMFITREELELRAVGEFEYAKKLGVLDEFNRFRFD